jgi:purine-binding chemotaxis protein CheW
MNAVTNNDNQGRYLCFSLGKEEYAIPLLIVREVIAVTPTTPIPFAPSHFLGIMNLRGQIISVIDLRLKLGIKSAKSEENAIIICDLGSTRLGIVIDSVNSVLTPAAGEITHQPELKSGKATNFVIGVYRKNDRLTLILDIAEALDVRDYQTLQKAG